MYVKVCMHTGSTILWQYTLVQYQHLFHAAGKFSENLRRASISQAYPYHFASK